MASAVKKTISLPDDLARETEALARAEGKTLSAVEQDAFRRAHIERQLRELRGMRATGAAKRATKDSYREGPRALLARVNVLFGTNILVSADVLAHLILPLCSGEPLLFQR